MAKETNKSSKKENKKFMKDFKAELKKVSWPTPKELANNTAAVVTIVIIVAVIVFALDLVFKSIDDYGIEKLKTIVSSTSENNSDENTSDESTKEDSTNEPEETNTVMNQVDENAENIDVTADESATE